MRRVFALFMLFPAMVLAGEQAHMGHKTHNADTQHTIDGDHHDHEGHLHTKLVNGKDKELDAERFDDFVADLTDSQIAVVSVSGMVCDFCARGIEKTFRKAAGFQKIDVDLASGKVLIAYAGNTQIIAGDIEQKILSNGQTVTDIQILSTR